jgi:hypothetical protein
MRSKFIYIASTGSYFDHPHTCSLIAKWKKTGYEKLCCLRCIQTKASVNDPASCVFILTDPLGHELPRFDMHLSRSQSASACWDCSGMCPLWYVIAPVASRRVHKPPGWQAVVVAVLTHDSNHQLSNSRDFGSSERHDMLETIAMAAHRW